MNRDREPARADCGRCYGNGCSDCGGKGWVETAAGREAREEWEDGAYDRDRGPPHGGRAMNPSDEARRRALHSYGLSDSQIAKKVGRAITTIRQWRIAAGLPANPHSKAISRKDHEARLALYRIGKTDGEIAAALGMRLKGIEGWRRRYGLPSKVGTGCPPVQLTDADETRRLALYRRGLTDLAIARALGRHVQAIFRWRQRRGLPANGRERKWERPAASFVSLDADLGEGGFNRYSFIPDDAASAWLEEQGATAW